MKTNIRITLLITCSLIAVACESSTAAIPDSGTGRDAAVATDAVATDAAARGPRGASNPPTLGTQIDRFGRPAISTALISAFDPMAARRGAAKDAYNANSDPATWVAMYAEPMRGTLTVLDILDQNCGNQTAYAAAMPAAMRHLPLAQLLADDQMVLNAAAGNTCDDSGYLAVEAGVAGNCGGRTPNADVIDRSYSVLAAGALTGVADAIAQSGPTHNTATFPFLAAP